MAHTRAWSETDPEDTDDIGDGASEIRAHRVDVRERMELDHLFNDDQTNDGRHQLLTLEDQAGDPTGISSFTTLYTKSSDVFIRPGTGTVRKFPFPLGTKMIFYQDAAPTGWTIENTLDDKLLFITKGSVAGGETGGGVHSTGTWTITTPDHVLTEDEMPAHVHEYSKITAAGAAIGIGTEYGAVAGDTESTGGGSAHSHGNITTWRPAAYCAIICTKD